MRVRWHWRRSLQDGNQKPPLICDVCRVGNIEAKRGKERQKESRAKPDEQVGKVVANAPLRTNDKGKARDIAAKAVGAGARYVTDAKRLAKEVPEVAKAAEAIYL